MIRKLPVVLIALCGCMTPQLASLSEADSQSRTVENLASTKEELFTRANRWMVGKFNNAESVVQHSDKEAGVIIGKYLMFGTVEVGSYSKYADSRVFAIIEINVRDDRAKIEVRPRGQWYYAPDGVVATKTSKDDAIKSIQNLMLSFEEAMRAKKSDF